MDDFLDLGPRFARQFDSTIRRDSGGASITIPPDSTLSVSAGRIHRASARRPWNSERPDWFRECG
jgi:hypothetical protein